MLATWMESPNFNDDLELLYFLYQPSKDALEKLLYSNEKESLTKLGR